MFRIEFYEDEQGRSKLWEDIEKLRLKAKKSKDDRIQYQQIVFYIQLLAENGTDLPINTTKHLGDGIWELRPGHNRVFYFFYERDTFVLLHAYRKKSQKTPHREIERAKTEKMDYIKRRVKK